MLVQGSLHCMTVLCLHHQQKCLIHEETTFEKSLIKFMIVSSPEDDNSPPPVAPRPCLPGPSLQPPPPRGICCTRENCDGWPECHGGDQLGHGRAERWVNLERESIYLPLIKLYVLSSKYSSVLFPRRGVPRMILMVVMMTVRCSIVQTTRQTKWTSSTPLLPSTLLCYRTILIQVSTFKW